MSVKQGTEHIGTDTLRFPFQHTHPLGSPSGRAVTCELNIDSRCVELRYSNGSMIAIDAPLEYAELVLSGELEGYLKRVSSPYSGIGWDS